MIFKNRKHAGEILAQELKKSKISKENSLLAGITRGGVVVAAAASQNLKIPLTAVVVKKLGAPANPELAIGATGAWGLPVVDRWLVADLKVPNEWLRREIRNKKKEAKRLAQYLGVGVASQFAGRQVVIVDDGLATGQTAKAAAKAAYALGASRVILAVPVGAPLVVEAVKNDFDKIICLNVEPNLEAVGQFYRDFRTVEDEEVKRILATSH